MTNTASTPCANALRAMVRDGQLLLGRRGGYAPARKLDLIPGVVLANAEGYGFLRPDEGGDDLYLSPQQMRTRDAWRSRAGQRGRYRPARPQAGRHRGGVAAPFAAPGGARGGRQRRDRWWCRTIAACIRT